VKLNIVVPCYNEQEVFPETSRRLEALLERLCRAGKIDPDSQLTFVDDGSRDATWQLIEAEAARCRRVFGIKLSRNRGHQNAALAGILLAKGDAVVTIDADLQDDIEAIEQMVDLHRAGIDIVYGVRGDRSSDSWFKRGSAGAFYSLLGLFGVELVRHHADFRLMSRRAVEALREFREANLYLRGIVPLLGFSSAQVIYSRSSRFAGTSKYPLAKMLALAVDAISSFSTVPLKIVTTLGLCVFVGTLVMSLWALSVGLFTDHAVPGWTSTVLPMFLLGGVQILCLGVLGTYLGRLYMEVKGRPRYFIDRTAGGSESND